MFKYKLIKTSNPVSLEDLTGIEKKINLKFPEELKSLYLKYNGGEVEGRRNFYVDRKNDIEKEIKTFLPVLHKRFEGDSLLEESYELFFKKKKLIPKEYIPFAMDSGGFRYCVNSDSGEIYFNNIDHLESPEGPMEWVASSMSEFIAGMLTEKDALKD